MERWWADAKCFEWKNHPKRIYSKIERLSRIGQAVLSKEQGVIRVDFHINRTRRLTYAAQEKPRV